IIPSKKKQIWSYIFLFCFLVSKQVKAIMLLKQFLERGFQSWKFLYKIRKICRVGFLHKMVHHFDGGHGECFVELTPVAMQFVECPDALAYFFDGLLFSMVFQVDPRQAQMGFVVEQTWWKTSRLKGD